jgi:RHS repeat-associated protein
VIQRTILTAFGEPLLPSPPEGEGQGEGGTGNTRYGYAGAWGYEEPEDSFDPLTDLGWLHVGERYYDPAVGRFMQRDPIGIEGGLNVYSYVGSNPAFWIDPTGRSLWEWVVTPIDKAGSYNRNTTIAEKVKKACIDALGTCSSASEAFKNYCQKNAKKLGLPEFADAAEALIEAGHIVEAGAVFGEQIIPVVLVP